LKGDHHAAIDRPVRSALVLIVIDSQSDKDCVVFRIRMPAATNLSGEEILATLFGKSV
jgi:hypothetical protein